MSKDVMEMNGEELRALRDGLPADHDPREIRMLNDRITDVSIAEGLARGFADQKDISTAEKLDKAAYDRYSGLNDEDSAFAKAVEKELVDRGDAKSNPRALMDAANSVAMDMGISPDSWNEGSTPSNTVRGSGSRNPFGEEKEEGGLNERQKEMMKDLAARGHINPNDKASMDRLTIATGGTVDDE